MRHRCSSLALETLIFYNLVALWGIARTTEQRQQLIKRMEPLAEENEKLREVKKLIEKNVQRAQRKRDLAESNTKDLEYQNGILSEQLKTVFEQLKSVSEQKKGTMDR